MTEFKIGLKALIRNKKRTLTVLLSFTALIYIVLLPNILLFTSLSSQELELEKTYGSWTHATVEKYETTEESDMVGRYYNINETLGSFDENMYKMANLQLYSGRLPYNNKEVVMTFEALSLQGKDYDLNQIINIEDNEFTLVGIIYPYNMDWVAGVDYPIIITKDLESENVIYFTKSENISPLIHQEDVLTVNINAYPYLEATGEMYTQRLDKISETKDIVLKTTNLLLLFSILIIAFVLKGDISFYKKRRTIFKTLGMSKVGIIKYLIVQLILYLTTISLLYFFAPLSLKVLLLPIEHVSLNYDVSIVGYSLRQTLIVVFSLWVTMLSIDTFRFKIKYRLNILQPLLVALTIFVTINQSSSGIIKLYEERIPEWKKYSKNLEDNLYYHATSSFNIFDMYRSLDRVWTKDEFENLVEHPNTKSLHYYTRKRLDETVGIFDESVSNNTLIFLDDASLFNTGFNISDEFLEGKSFYYYGEPPENLVVGKIYSFNNQNLIFEKIVTLNPDDDFLNLTDEGILVSQAGAKNMNIDSDKFNTFIVEAKNTKDILEYDLIVSRLSKGAYFDNARLTIERAISKEKRITIFLVLEILVQFMFGIILLAMVFFQLLMQKRNTMGIYHLLGEQKRTIIFRNSIKYVLPGYLITIPTVIYIKRMMSMSQTFGLALITYFLTNTVLLFVCLIIHILYLSKEVLILLDERE